MTIISIIFPTYTLSIFFFFFQAEDGIRDPLVTGVQTCALPISLHGERDEEHQFGVTIPFHGWTLDAGNFLTRAVNFFDHNNFNNSDLFFPITIRSEERRVGKECIYRWCTCD